jgi:hypothetical protein
MPRPSIPRDWLAYPVATLFPVIRKGGFDVCRSVALRHAGFKGRNTSKPH